MKKIGIHYFSGTGNTARAVGILSSRLEGAGISATRWVIGGTAPELGEETEAEVFAFPALGFAAPVMVKRYVRRLPAGGGRKAYVLCVNAGGPMQALDQMERMLRRRGYEVVLTASAAYPVNWTQAVNPMEGVREAEALERGDRAALDFAEDILSGTSRFHRVSSGTLIWSGAVSALFGALGRRILGKAFIADSRCTRCGYCAQTCPAGTIRMDGQGGKPRWRSNCQNCNRCINLCPVAAIQSSSLRLGVHIAANLVSTVAGVFVGIRAGGALGAAGVGLAALPGGVAAGLLVFLAGTVLQFTLLDAALGGLGAKFPKAFESGPTAAFRRYRAPGFSPRPASGIKNN